MNHQHFLATLKEVNYLPSERELEEWMVNLVETIDMKILSGPHITYCNDPGNEGITGIVGITTSHASIHIWEKQPSPFAKFDLYSCKYFDLDKVIQQLKYFKPVYVNGWQIDRNFSDAHVTTNIIERLVY